MQHPLRNLLIRGHWPRQPDPVRQGGFSATELALAMLVVVVLIGFAVYLVQSALRTASVNENVSTLQMIAAKAKSTFGRLNQYGEVTTAIAVRSNVIPGNLRDGTAATANNPFGAPITVVPATTAGAGAPNVLDITWGDVPDDQCTEIVVGVESSARQIIVGSTVVKPFASTLNIASLTTSCEASNEVDLTFRIGR